MLVIKWNRLGETQRMPESNSVAVTVSGQGMILRLQQLQRPEVVEEDNTLPTPLNEARVPVKYEAKQHRKERQTHRMV
jgi:hypothetical protein